MTELIYKLLYVALIVAMNFIRTYFKRRYKRLHRKDAEIAPRREKLLTQMMFCAMALPGMLWIFTTWLGFGQFALPDWVRLAGFAVGVWAMWWFYVIHRTLGDNWSPVLETRREHTLVVTGPYRYVRHPMYTDMLLWAVSFSLLTANWFYASTLAVGLAILLSIRIPDEERLMAARFGDEYRNYMRQTKRLIPLIL
ncbi:MAG: isoprenylcysteine carboxylmethyltransferase family protein [Tannerella sp.]|jgi:protein-S-isoprenylcysteine O-methyltransferase Ste14|nr:isoprenylcysteine carboxylmethyltransferase family protein [Tannerella sp.]